MHRLYRKFYAWIKNKIKRWYHSSFSIPLFIGGGLLFHIAKRAIIKKDFKELDEAIKSKVPPYLYNGGKGAMVPIAQLALMRNRFRSSTKQLPVIKELGSDACDFVFEGSQVLERLTKRLNPEKSPHLFRECCWRLFCI